MGHPVHRGRKSADYRSKKKANMMTNRSSKSGFHAPEAILDHPVPEKYISLGIFLWHKICLMSDSFTLRIRIQMFARWKGDRNALAKSKIYGDCFRSRCCSSSAQLTAGEGGTQRREEKAKLPKEWVGWERVPYLMADKAL